MIWISKRTTWNYNIAWSWNYKLKHSRTTLRSETFATSKFCKFKKSQSFIISRTETFTNRPKKDFSWPLSFANLQINIWSSFFWVLILAKRTENKYSLIRSRTYVAAISWSWLIWLSIKVDFITSKKDEDIMPSRICQILFMLSCNDAVKTLLISKYCMLSTENKSSGFFFLIFSGITQKNILYFNRSWEVQVWIGKVR